MLAKHNRSQRVIEPRSLWLLTGVGVAFFVPLALFAKLASEVLEREPIGLDEVLLTGLRSFANPRLTEFVLLVTHLGDTLVIGLASLVIGAVLWLKQRRRDAVQVFATAGGAAIMNYALKVSFQRARPTLVQAMITESSYSFPSGHSMVSSALIFALVAIAWPTRWRWPVVVGGVVFTGTIGLSRIYLGVHYPSDVVAAWCVSFVWALLVHLILHADRGRLKR